MVSIKNFSFSLVNGNKVNFHQSSNGMYTAEIRDKENNLVIAASVCETCTDVFRWISEHERDTF